MRQAVYGILFNEDKTQIILVKRRDLPVWVFPGGGLDEGETPEIGVIREVEEETGLKVEIVRKIAEYEPVNKLTQKTHYFECKAVGGIPKPSSESKEVAFFPLSKMPKRLAPPFALWLADALEEKKEVIKKPTEGVTYLILVKLLILHPILVIRYFLTKIGIRFNAQD
jgi:8-oxo-dGTP diphosphatase